MVGNGQVKIKAASSVIQYPTLAVNYSDSKNQPNQQAFVKSVTFNHGNVPQELTEKQAVYKNTFVQTVGGHMISHGGKMVAIQEEQEVAPVIATKEEEEREAAKVPEEIEMNEELCGICFTQNMD